MMNSIKNI